MANTGDRPGDGRDATQRIRVGLTGLAGVLVLVLLAAAVLGLRSADGGLALVNGAHLDNGTETPKDPLAELGVTPGGSGDPAAAPTPAAPSSPPATTLPPATPPARTGPPPAQ